MATANDVVNAAVAFSQAAGAWKADDDQAAADQAAAEAADGKAVASQHKADNSRQSMFALKATLDTVLQSFQPEPTPPAPAPAPAAAAK